MPISWKLPPSIRGHSTTDNDNWKVPPPIRDNSTTSDDKWKSPSLTPNSKKTPTAYDDPFDDNISYDDDSSTHDDDLTTPAVNHWKVPPPTLGDSSTKNIPTKWNLRSSYGDNSKKATPIDNNWKLSALIEDDNSSRTTSPERTTSADNPEVPPPPPPPPPIHDDDSAKIIPPYTPYLQLPHLLSLSWLTYPVISLILVAFRIQLSLASVVNGLDTVKNNLLSSCTSAEKSATAAASLPRFLAETSNRQFAEAANGVMNGAHSALILSLTILENTINFAIDMYRSTFFCLLQLAVSVGMSLVTDAVQVLSTSVATIGNNLATEITNANTAVTNTINDINKANPFKKIPAPPAISTSDLSSLQNLALPSTFQSTLSSINSSVPTTAQVKDKIENLVNTPFELLKKLINGTFDNLTFDAAIFPVPAENRLSFCNDLDTSSIDGIKENLIKIARYGTFVIIGLAAVLIGLNCLLIWSKWRSMMAHLDRTREAWASDPAANQNVAYGFSPSAPQVTHGDHNLMMSQAASGFSPSAPQVTRSDHNPMMSQAASGFSPSAPQVTRDDHNLMMSQATPRFPPSAPQVTRGDHNSMMPQATPRFPPSAPQVTRGDHNSMMPQAASGFPPSAPQVTRSDHNLIMSQAASRFSPSAPQVTRSDHDLMMSGAAYESSPSAPQVTRSDHNLMMSGAAYESSPSAPQVTRIDHNLMMPGAASEFSPVPQFALTNHNLMTLLGDSENPIITRIMNVLAARSGLTPTQNIDMRWFFHYVFHPPALACFLIGFFGLLSVMVQLLLLGPLLAAARAGIEIAVSDLTNSIAHTINLTMHNQSSSYADDINSKVDVVQNAINNGLFKWVNGTTTMLNTTINNFYTEVQDFVSGVFNGTILENPALNFLQCVIGNKVNSIEKALTFLHDNLAIEIPRISQDVLVLSPQAVSEATGPIASGAIGGGSSGDQGLLGATVALYENSLKAEAVVFGAFMGLWGVVVVIAICILLWRTQTRKRKAKRQMAIMKRQLAIMEAQEEKLEDTEGYDFSSPGPDDEKDKDLFMD